MQLGGYRSSARNEIALDSVLTRGEEGKGGRIPLAAGLSIHLACVEFHWTEGWPPARLVSPQRIINCLALLIRCEMSDEVYRIHDHRSRTFICLLTLLDPTERAFSYFMPRLLRVDEGIVFVN